MTKLQVEEFECEHENHDASKCKYLEGVHWKLLSPLIYRGSRDEFVVPAGFVTDFGSVPWVFQWLVPGAKRGKKAFVLHDYLYDRQLLDVPRSDADGMMRRVLRELEYWPIRYWSAWIGVRVGGWYNWSKSKQAREKNP